MLRSLIIIHLVSQLSTVTDVYISLKVLNSEEKRNFSLQQLEVDHVFIQNHGSFKFLLILQNSDDAISASILTNFQQQQRSNKASGCKINLCNMFHYNNLT